MLKQKSEADNLSGEHKTFGNETVEDYWANICDSETLSQGPIFEILVLISVTEKLKRLILEAFYFEKKKTRVTIRI